MLHTPKLFLYSLAISGRHAEALTRLVGKTPTDITFALIENAADVEPGAADWLEGFRKTLRSHGYQVEPIDLRKWTNKRKALHEKLKTKDVIWLGGGNTFYLRWILKKTGADEIIKTLVTQGKVYAGWSAGAIMAGPTLQYFDLMDNPKESPEVIWTGLNLTNVVVVPHLDNERFAEEAKKTNQHLKQAGYTAMMLADNQAILINGEEQTIL